MSDPNKTQWRGMKFRVLDEVAKVITEGDKKYNPGDWVTKDNVLFFDALMRHISLWRQGEKDDPEDGLHHLAHAIVNCMYLMEKEKIGLMCSYTYPDTFTGGKKL